LSSAVGQVRGLLLLVAEQVAGLAAEGLAEGGQGGETDGAGAAVLEDRQVDHGDPDLVGEFGEGHVALFQQPVEMDGDVVVARLGGISDGAFDVFAQPQAVGEHLGQDQDGQAEDQRQRDRGANRDSPRPEVTTGGAVSARAP
jgi:hypothetical protein